MSSSVPPTPEPTPTPTPGALPDMTPPVGAMPPPAPATLAPTKKTLSTVALVLTVLSSLLIIASTWLALRGITPESVAQMDFTELMAAAEDADAIRLGALGIASLINLAAFIVAIIGIVKERPKTMAIIALVATFVLPGIAFAVSGAMMNSAMETLMASVSL